MTRRINCVVMAGGRGSRLGGIEKPLLEVCGAPMLVRVLRALEHACARVVVAYSPWTRGVEDLCRTLPPMVECVEGRGSYVEDLKEALMLAGLPALVAPSDIPFLNPRLLEAFLEKALSEPADVVNLAGEDGEPTGISLFKSMGGEWASIVMRGEWLIDVDTPEDLERAGSLCWLDRASGLYVK